MATSEWPLDEDGKPMAKVTMGASEKVGMPHFSNVDLGPASITRFVKDDPESIKESLREGVKLCEEIIGEERGPILDIVEKAILAAHGE